MELIVSHSFDLQTNMEEVKQSIVELIANYDVVVEEDKLADAKKMMAQINKDKKDFSEKCKSFIDQISVPIVEFKTKQKEIETVFTEGYKKIGSQVDKFEARRLKEIEDFIAQYRDTECAEKSIDPASVPIKDLVKLTAVNTTQKGFTPSKETQREIFLRITAVENQILKAKQEAEEKAKRDREIAEKAKAEAEEQARKREAELIAKAEREKAEAVEKARLEEQAKQTPPKVQIEEIDRTANPPQPDGKKVWKITAHFEVLASATIDPNKITDKLKSMIEGAGITSLKSIEAV
jgi:hypothetical protein